MLFVIQRFNLIWKNLDSKMYRTNPIQIKPVEYFPKTSFSRKIKFSCKIANLKLWYKVYTLTTSICWGILYVSSLFLNPISIYSKINNVIIAIIVGYVVTLPVVLSIVYTKYKHFISKYRKFLPENNTTELKYKNVNKLPVQEPQAINAFKCGHCGAHYSNLTTARNCQCYCYTCHSDWQTRNYPSDGIYNEIFKR